MQNIKPRIISQTKSICNVCFKEISARTFEENGKIYIEKECPNHGYFKSEHFWDDPETYSMFLSVKSAKPDSANISISLTQKCNLNCAVCYARANEKETKDFDFNELYLVKNHEGVMLTGGEPTMRKDLARIIKRLKGMGKRVVIFSNGLKFSSRKYLNFLKKAGLNAIFFHLDTLDENKSSKPKDGIEFVALKQKAIENIQAEGIPLYFYSLVVRDNLEDMEKIINYSLGFSVVKMISFDVLGMFGRCDGGEYVSTSEIVKRLCKILKISKKEFFECSRFLNTVDKLSLFFLKRRLFTKCFLKCPVLVDRGKLIPICRIFDVKRINDEAEKVGVDRVDRFMFLIKTFYREVALNLIFNRYFRLMLKKILINSKFIFLRKHSLANPFFFIDVMIVPSPGNIDRDFYQECNFYAITSSSKIAEPACISRVKQGSGSLKNDINFHS